MRYYGNNLCRGLEIMYDKRYEASLSSNPKDWRHGLCQFKKTGGKDKMTQLQIRELTPHAGALLATNGRLRYTLLYRAPWNTTSWYGTATGTVHPEHHGLM